MRRIGFVFFLLILAGLGAAPYVDGLLFKMIYLKNLAILNQEGAGAVTVKDYQVGYLNSTVILASMLPEGKGEMTVNQQISHGPIVRDAKGGFHFARAMIFSTVHFPKDIEVFLLGPKAAEGVLQISTLVNFPDTYVSEFHTPIFAIQNSNAQATWQGLSGSTSMTFGPDYIANMEHKLKFGASSGVVANGKFSSKDSTLNGVRTCTSAISLCSGSGEISATNFNMMGADNQSVNIDNYKMNYNYGGDANNHYNLDLDTNIGKVAALDYNVNALHFKLKEKNLNKDKLAKLVVFVRDHFLNNPIRIGSKEMAERHESESSAAITALGMLPAVIDPNTSLALDFSANTTDGKITMNIAWGWSEAKAPASLAELSQKQKIQINSRATTTFVNHMILLADKNNPNAGMPPVPTQAVAVATAPVVTVNKSAEAFKQMVVDLVMQKKLTAPVGKSLTDFEESRVSMSAMQTYINKLVGAGVAQEIGTTLAEAYQKVMDEVNSMPIPPLAVTPDGHKDYKGQLGVLVAQKRINPQTQEQLLALQEQKLDPEIYNASIDKMAASDLISPPLGEQLKKQYSQLATTTSSEVHTGTTTAALAAGTVTAPGVPAAPNDAQTQPVPAEEPIKSAKQAFDKLIKLGIVVQDKDDYVIAFEYKDGMISINGKTMTPEEFNAMATKQ